MSSNVPGGDISAPKFSLCLPVPYVKERAFSAGLTAQLASFLLYSLSPFNPNPDILDNKDLLTELTKQYKESGREMSCLHINIFHWSLIFWFFHRDLSEQKHDLINTGMMLSFNMNGAEYHDEPLPYYDLLHSVTPDGSD